MPKSMSGGARPAEIDHLSVRRPSRFLKRIWDQHEDGFVFLAARNPNTNRWIDEAFNVPVNWSDVAAFLTDHSHRTYDIYYCPNVFSKPRRLAFYALPTPFVWCDIDGADPSAFNPRPTFLTSTSPGRHQGLWQLDAPINPGQAAALSKDLAYRFGGDPTGWSITKYLRVPGTTNHKPAYDRPPVTVEEDMGETIAPWTVPEEGARGCTTDLDLDPFAADPAEVARRYRKKLRSEMYWLMTDKVQMSRDRSRCIFMIVAALHEAGATKDEIAAVVWRSPYFISKYGQSLRSLNQEVGRILAKLGGVR